MATKRIAVVVTVEHDPSLGTSEEVTDALRHLLSTTPCAALSDDLGAHVVALGRTTQRRRELHWRDHDPLGNRVKVWDARQARYGVYDVLDRAAFEATLSDPSAELVRLTADEDDVPFGQA